MPFSSVCYCVPQRWIVCALLSLAIAIISYKNSCFYAVADIVATYTEAHDMPKNNGCFFSYSGNVWSKQDLPFPLPNIFWNPYLSNIEDSSFHVGKFLLLIPAGMLSDIGFSKYVLIVGMTIVSITHLIQPVVINAGIGMKLLLQVIEGAAEATLFPSVISLISRWTPSRQRNLFTALVIAGIFYGEILGQLLFKLIYVETQSWNAGQYITGTIGIAWSCVSFVFVYHSPEDSPFVSQHEYRRMSSGRRRSSPLQVLNNLATIPWVRIVSSRAFISLVLVFCTIDWLVPTNADGLFRLYQPYVLRLPEGFGDSSAVTTSLACIPAMVMGGYFADRVVREELMSKTAVKRALAFVSIFFSSVLLLLASLVGCSVLLFWVLSCVGVFVLGLAQAVIYCVPVDLSTRHAGLLMAIIQCVRIMCLIFSESVETKLVPNIYDTSQWVLRCFVFASAALLLTIPFLIFGSVERQHWQERRGRRRSPSVTLQPYSLESKVPDT